MLRSELPWVVKDGRGGANDEAAEYEYPEVAGLPDLSILRNFDAYEYCLVTSSSNEPS